MRRWRRDAFVLAALFSLWNGDGMRDLLSWWGFGAVSLALLAGGIVLLVHERRRLRTAVLSSRAVPIAAFVALCVVSVTWSAYPLETVAGCFIQIITAVVAVALTVAAPPRRLAVLFAAMIHFDLVLSLVFEAVVALSPQHMLLPFFTDYGANVPGAYYWSSGLLFSGGRIQGFTANANLLGFLALLGGVTIACLARTGIVGRRTLVGALVLDVAVLALTRSATVIIAGGVTFAAALVIAGLRRVGPRGRTALVVVGLGLIAVVALGSSRLSEPFLRLLGKGDDFTGRLEIWRLVGTLVQERPVLGWGWIGYWAPWIHPFKGFVVRDGVQYLQAHNAFLDVEMQLGVPGLLVLVAVVGSVVYRALRLALTRLPLAVLPLLLLIPLLTQGLAESRLLIEGNWALLAALSVALPVPAGRTTPRPPDRRPAAAVAARSAA